VCDRESVTDLPAPADFRQWVRDMVDPDPAVQYERDQALLDEYDKYPERIHALIWSAYTTGMNPDQIYQVVDAALQAAQSADNVLADRTRHRIAVALQARGRTRELDPSTFDVGENERRKAAEQAPKREAA
jgi:hypothetical protein